MFTGIVTNEAVLRDKKTSRRGVSLTFEVLGHVPPFRLGQSVAVDGVCVTVAAFRRKKFSVDLLAETLKGTTLDRRSVGERVNFERALRVGDEVGGHWVTGHVDGVGRIVKMVPKAEGFSLKVETPRSLMRSLMPKGSVAVDGISFTVQTVHRDAFEVGVTPHTFRVTTLSCKREGDTVNLEVDHFAKVAEQFLSRKKRPSLTVKALQAQGF